MSQRFVRCAHCGLPHDISEVRCPITGQPVRPAKRTVMPPANPKPSSAHMAAAKPALPPRPMVKASAGVMALVGRVIDGKYGVKAVIGEGGMGAVYEAEHLVLGRMVALKVLNPQNSTRPEAVSRFRHEARVAGSIGHPNICEIYDVGNLEDGTPYLVMERLVGDSLADRINKEGALPFMDVLGIVIQVLSGLVAAHRKGVIHRDIKPENVFLSVLPGREMIVKLLDFGISKAGSIDADLHLTRTGMVMGTPYYMAPEQARGERVDPRIDIYATGVILYESLTGRRPFLAPNYNALLVQILSGVPRSIRDIRPAIPEGFEPIVAKAMSKQAADRYQTATEFLEALARLRDELARTLPKPREVQKLVEAAKASERPPPMPLVPRGSARSPSEEIPIHFSPPSTAPAEAEKATEQPSPATTPAGPPTVIPTGQEEVSPLVLAPPPADLVADTYVDGALPDELADLTQVGAYVPGAPRSRPVDSNPEQTIQSRPLNAAEAEEIIRAAQNRTKARPLAANPLRPAQGPLLPGVMPADLARRPIIPREEDDGPRPPRESEPRAARRSTRPPADRETTHPDPPPELPPMPPIPQQAAPALPALPEDGGFDDEEPTALYQPKKMIVPQPSAPRPASGGQRIVPPPPPASPAPASGQPQLVPPPSPTPFVVPRPPTKRR